MRTFLVLLLMSLATVPAFAETAAPVQNDAPQENVSGQCAAFLQGMDLIKQGKDFAVRDSHDGCVISNALYQHSSVIGWTVDRIEIEGDRLKSFLSGAENINKAAPLWGRVDLDGIRFTLLVDDPSTKYINAVQQWPMDISAAYRLDPADGYLHIQNVQVSSVRLGNAVLSAELGLPVGASMDELVQEPKITLSHLRLRLDNQGLWEGMAVPALISYANAFSSSGTTDAEAAVEQLRGSIAASLQLLPESQIDVESRKALLRFVQDMPHPTGFFTLDFDFEKPLAIDEKTLGGNPDPTTFARYAIAGAKISATYKPR